MRRGGKESVECERWMQITPGVYLCDCVCLSSAAVILKEFPGIFLMARIFWITDNIRIDK